MSTEFFVSTETYDMSRDAWSNATGLPEGSTPEEFAEAFKEKHFRNALAEEFLHSWKPDPTVDQVIKLDKLVTDQARTIPIAVSVFESGDTVIVEYAVSVPLEVSEAGRDRPDLDATFGTPNPVPVILAAGMATGYASSFLVKKNLGLKVLVGTAAGVVGMVLVSRLLGKKAGTAA
jgi:hypothetical protein